MKTTKKINLLSLNIQNFKGIKNLSFDLSDFTNIYGRNESGKTSIFDAYSWLTTGKTSTDNEKFPIKRLDENGQVIHELTVSVEAVFEIYELDLITFEKSEIQTLKIRREFEENWGAERKGSSNIILKGNTNKYFWNDAPIKTETEYLQRIESVIGNYETFKLLSNPLFFSSDFNTWGWKKRRELLEKIANVDLSDEWVLTQNPDLADFIEGLKIKSISDLVNEANHNKSGIKKQIESINVRIDENDKAKAEPVDEAPINKAIEELKAELSAIDQSLADRSRQNAAVNDQKIKIQNEIFSLKSKAQQLENTALNEYNSIKQNAESLVNDLKNQIKNLNDRIASGKDYVSQLDKQIESSSNWAANSIKQIEEKQNDLRAQFKALNEESFTFDEAHQFCKDPLCGKRYDQSVLDGKHGELLAKYNQDKEVKKADINKKGLALKNEIEKIKSDLESQQAEAKAAKEKYTSAIEKMEGEISERKDALNLIETNGVENPTPEERLKEAPEHAEIIKRIEVLTNELNALSVDNSASIDQSLSDQKKEIYFKIETLHKQLEVNANNKKLDDRINELKDEKQRLGVELSKLDKVGFDALEYERIKYEELERKVNSMFKYVRFKMFNKLQNGGYEPTCVTTYKGVPFVDGGLNTAAKYFSGIDIINTLSEYFGLIMPIFLDNRESVSQIPETNAQIVNLIVSAEDDVLRVVNF